jgi:hypothetical protein
MLPAPNMVAGSQLKFAHDGFGHEVIRVDVQDALTFFPGLSIPVISQEKKHEKIAIVDHRTISVDQCPKHGFLAIHPGCIQGIHVKVWEHGFSLSEINEILPGP